MYLLRLQIFKHFAAVDFFLLAVGKVMPFFRSEKFRKLQDKEIKLDIVFRHGQTPIVVGNRVTLVAPLHGHDLELNLDLEGSDVMVFNQVIVQESYRVVIELFKEFFDSLPISVIDAGANIGLASMYFAVTCPNAFIFAIEPDQQNVDVARRHITSNGLNSVDLRLGALWPENRSLSLVNDFRDQLSWSFRVQEKGQGEIAAITPADALRFFMPPVDLFKIDIEGAESQLFKKGVVLDWLQDVKMIAIEVHEEYIKHSEIMEILEHYGFHVRLSGELTIGINRNFRNANRL